MRKRLFVLLVMAVVVAGIAEGCTSTDRPSSDTAKKAASDIVYVRDARTGLCFATITSTTSEGWAVVSITNVPCEKVEHLLVQ